MGKRELLLLMGFLIVGGLIYQLTAPASDAEGPSRSWSDVFRHARGEMFGGRARFQVEREVKVPVGGEVKTLDLGGMAGRVEVVGEDRADVEGRGRATLLGESEEEVRAAADGLQFTLEPDGDTLRLKLTHPDGWRLGRQGRPGIDLTLRVPAHLSLEADVAGVLEVSNVAGLRIDNGRGNATVKDVKGEVSGEFRDGNIELDGAGRIDLQARRTTLRLSRVSGEVEVELSDGRLVAEHLPKKTTLNTRRAAIELTGQDGPIEIEGADGSASIGDLAAELTFDGTRLPLQVALAKPVPVTVEASEAPVQVALPDGGFSLDVRCEEGGVEVAKGLPEPTRTENETTVTGKVAGGGPVIKVTATRTTVILKRATP